MKKINFMYAAMWYFVFIAVAVLIVLVGIILQNDTTTYFIAGAVFILGAMFYAVPEIKKGAMKKKATALEQGFKYDYKFTTTNAVFYIDASGKLGVLWRGNPSHIQLANLAELSDVRTNDGKKLLGTSRVSCQFNLAGSPFRINTLLVSRGQLPMNSPQVVEAISKADKLCEMLNTAKSAALAGHS